MKSIVIDMDDTICFPNHQFKDTKRKYSQARPNTSVIEKMKELKKIGFHISILSARRMLTHNGDITRIEEDVLKVTEVWLDLHEVPYDDLIFGKPFSTTYYVDDKAMTVDNFIVHNFGDP